MSVAGTLAAFVDGSRWQDLPGAIVHEGKRSLLNFFGCALGAARDEAVEMAVATLLPFSGVERVSVIGRAERLDPLNAAFVNAIAANLLDFDDTHLETVIHPTAPVAAPVLAVAEHRGRSGRELLHAFVLGAEVECRIGLGVSPGHYDRGWHITATCGVFGAAAACARLLGLPAEGIEAALAIAASQSAGVVENLASSAKNVGVGGAARAGLLAALLAQAGYRGAGEAIEGKLGWARAMGDVPDLERMCGGLGTRWEFGRNTYKPYPSGIVFHAVIEAGLAVREQAGGREVASVTVYGDRLLLDRGDRDTLTARDARVSIAHNAAVALARGTARPADFEQKAVNDPVLRRLRGLVHAELDDSMPRGAARMEVCFTDGSELHARIDTPSGSLERPMTDRMLEEKFRSLVHDGADRRVATLWQIESLDAAALMHAMSSDPEHCNLHTTCDA